MKFNCVQCGKEVERVNYNIGLCRSCIMTEYFSHFENKKNRLEKTKKTCLERYGVEYLSQAKHIKEKVKQTCLKNNTYEKVTKKRKQALLKKYGIDNPLKVESIKQQVMNTNIKRYGNTCPLKNKEVKEKSQKTLKKNYNVENPSQSEEIREKRKQTFLRKYNVTNSMLIKPGKKVYEYKNTFFDSSWELAYWIYCKDHDIQIERNIEFFFEFKVENKIHRFYPDFILENNKFLEIKGDHLLNGIFDDSHFIKQKLKICKKNNIEIINKSKILFYLNYIKENYGKNFLKEQKRKK
jgi:hypothetical protein